MSGAATDRYARFTVLLAQPAERDAHISWATEDGNDYAVPGCAAGLASQDYTASQGRLTIAAGQTQDAIYVPVCASSANRPQSVFFLKIKPGNGAVVLNSQVIAIIPASVGAL